MSSVRVRALDPGRNLTTDQQLVVLEKLVDELLRHSPSEERIRAYMLEAGLDYITDPIARMNNIMALLNGLRSRSHERITEKS